VTVTLYAAASLGDVIDTLIASYNEEHPEVTVVTNYDSSGTLLEGIEAANGTGIDLFFSAAQKQMDSLEADGLVEEGTRVNVVNNQLCLITYPGSDVADAGVASLSDLAKTTGTVAICDGTVPAGKYTRQALVNLGILSEDMEETEGDVSTIPGSDISDAFGGIEITEPANVTAARQAVQEQSCVLGTCYLSDTYDVSTGAQFTDLEVLETVSYDLTGNIIYPLARVVNSEADEATVAAAQSFYEYLISDAAKEVYTTFLFDTNVE
jgi:molybdate transport system substrate-binding protein